jgi:hypothetical protein
MRFRGKKPSSDIVARVVRQRIEAEGERVWRLADFDDLPFTPVARALSRLTKAGLIQRLSKGTYFRPRQTALGKSRPSPAAVQMRASDKTPLFPAGIAAANLLGFTTQNPARTELATSGFNLPRKLLDPKSVVHTRRPAAWARLSIADAAILDFLRRGGRTSELSGPETVDRTLRLLSNPGHYERLIRVASSEPPRVRALLGALGEQLGKKPKDLDRLRASLNPASRFDFGLLNSLPNARQWQAKDTQQ